MAKADKTMPKEDEEISMSALLEIAIKNKKIAEVGNFSINNDLLQVANILLQSPYNAKADICHSCKRFVVNFMGKKKQG